MKLRKLVVYSHDTFGLGNIRRMLLISQYLLDSCDDLSILLISGSPVIHNLPLPRERFDYLKLPCLSRTQEGGYGVRYLSAEFNDMVALRAQIIRISVEKFEPDLVLVDKKPCGVAGELAATLELLEKRNTQVILLLRDILDAPDVTKSIWRKHNYHQAIERYYQRILVVGSPDIFDICKEYDLPDYVAEKVLFCGYTHRGDSAEESRLPKLSNLNGKKLVLVTPGGGEDGFQLINTYLEGLKAFVKPSDHESIVITGPEMAESQVNEVKAAASKLPGVEVQVFARNIPEYIRRADLVVSMAGYNTLCEILSLNRRVVVVPRVRPVQEQWIRAQRFAWQGLLTCIHPDRLTPISLITAVRRELENGLERPEIKPIEFNGLANISAYICSALESTRDSYPSTYNAHMGAKTYAFP